MATTHKMGIILNGVTGRMGTNQHLARSIAAIREEGGIKVDGGDVIMPEPILVGRNEEKLKALAEEYGNLPYSTDLEGLLQDDAYPIYFDSQTTLRRVADGSIFTAKNLRRRIRLMRWSCFAWRMRRG